MFSSPIPSEKEKHDTSMEQEKQAFPSFPGFTAPAPSPSPTTGGFMFAPSSGPTASTTTLPTDFVFGGAAPTSNSSASTVTTPLFGASTTTPKNDFVFGSSSTTTPASSSALIPAPAPTTPIFGQGSGFGVQTFGNPISFGNASSSAPTATFGTGSTSFGFGSSTPTFPSNAFGSATPSVLAPSEPFSFGQAPAAQQFAFGPGNQVQQTPGITFDAAATST